MMMKSPAVSGVAPGGSSRWAQPPCKPRPEGAEAARNMLAARRIVGELEEGWAMTRRGIRCWPLRRCSRTAAPLPDAHEVRSQPRSSSHAVVVAAVVVSWWCRCSSRCVLPLAPILGCALPTAPVQRRRSSTAASPVTRAHQHSSPTKAPRWAPSGSRTPLRLFKPHKTPMLTADNVGDVTGIS